MANVYHLIKQIMNIYNQKKIKREEPGLKNETKKESIEITKNKIVKYNTTPNLINKPILINYSKVFDKVMPSYYSYPNLLENEEQVMVYEPFSNSISISLVLGMTFVIGRFIYRQSTNKK
jgi:hypothetical protein